MSTDHRNNLSSRIVATGLVGRGNVACGIVAALSIALSGCATDQPATVEIAPGEYPRAFNAAREAIRDWRFRLDRVDAASGVITTYEKASSGLATPWDDEQTGIDQEWEDFANRQRRRVRVTFAEATPGVEHPAAAGAEASGAKRPPDRVPGAVKTQAVSDLRDSSRPIVATVEVTIERVQRPGWQVSTKSINQSTFMRDPALEKRGLQPWYSVELDPDVSLARRIAAEIRRKLASGEPIVPTVDEPDPDSAASANDEIDGRGVGTRDGDPRRGAVTEVIEADRADAASSQE